MTTDDRGSRTRDSIAAVRRCAETIDARAAGIVQVLAKAPVDGRLRSRALDVADRLRDVSGRVLFELALLQAEPDDTDTLLRSLVGMDATMMDALSAVAELADALESAAELDAELEPAFVLVIESAGVMMQGLEQARAATEALERAAKRRAPG